MCPWSARRLTGTTVTTHTLRFCFTGQFFSTLDWLPQKTTYTTVLWSLYSWTRVSQHPSTDRLWIIGAGFFTGQTRHLGRSSCLWVKVLCPTWHKIGHYGDVLSSQSLGWNLKKLNRTHTTKADIHPAHKNTTTQNKPTNQSQNMIAVYDLRPGNGAGPILQLPGTIQSQGSSRTGTPFLLFFIECEMGVESLEIKYIKVAYRDRRWWYVCVCP